MNNTVSRKKAIIIQQFSAQQINNGGPATGALMLLDSSLNKIFEFIPMSESFSFKKNGFKQLLYFYKTINKIQPDIVHIRGVQLTGFWGVLASRLNQVKVIMSVHGLNIDIIKQSKLKRFFFNCFIEKWALRKADLVYCVSEFAAKRQFIKDNTKNLFGVIHNAAPDYDNYIAITNKEKLREQYGFTKEDFVISLVSRITHDKGFEFMAKAIPVIVKEKANIKFLIAGDGCYLEVFKSQVYQYINSGHVICLGQVSDVKTILLSSDTFVLPSLHENLSNSLLEASAMGLPLIATNVGGNPEVVIDDYSGILFPPNNINKLKEAIISIAADQMLQKKFARNSRNIAKTKFSNALVLSQVKSVYDSLLK